MSNSLIVNSHEVGCMIFDLLMCNSREEFVNVDLRNVYDYTNGFVSDSDYDEYSDITFGWYWGDNGIVEDDSNELVNITSIVFVDYDAGLKTEWTV